MKVAVLLQEFDSKCMYLKGSGEKLYGMDSCFTLRFPHHTLPLFGIKYLLTFVEFTIPIFR